MSFFSKPPRYRTFLLTLWEERTVALYRQIRTGRLVGHSRAIANGDGRTFQEASPTLDETPHHLNQLQTTVAKVKHRLQEAI